MAFSYNSDTLTSCVVNIESHTVHIQVNMVLSKSVDGFHIYHFPNDKEYSNHIYNIFGIKARCGLIFRQCPECKRYNKLDDHIYSAYLNYVKLKQAIIYKKFYFDCLHPIFYQEE